MKRLFILLLIVWAMPLLTIAQEQVDTVVAQQAKRDSIKFEMEQDSLLSAWTYERESIKAVKKLKYAKEMQEATKFLPRYKIYRTEFIRTLLKLDTRTGTIQKKVNQTTWSRLHTVHSAWSIHWRKN